ncbi:DNA cytosine methyltransferase [Pimelobacter simplex]|uniref:DNA cytosine methyltransferase n=1 Tax=Nocardioides simplex TaxID=2045 RepID=UPI0021501060|nr:DNA cytosine methyltransferase [Pimelobacter simplex]UUW92247.1 DNA cytosine methyltransferase [Pimelobacter simplex]UUW96074.1 DNA cytosine methyltransferase [Pimelobacter simplex]
MSGEAQHPLLLSDRPDFEAGHPTVRLVDLFSGCGGLTLGVAQAAEAAGTALEIPLAIDSDADAGAVYESNFPKADFRQTTVGEFFGPRAGEPLADFELRVAEEVGTVTALVGGPPCQGHSDLNNHTRRRDPKNALYGHMSRAAEVLQPQAVLIENVPAVQHDKHAGEGVVARVERELRGLGFDVASGVVALAALGVAQRRRRHVLLAVREGLTAPADVLADLADRQDFRDLRWAIEDLVKAAPTGIDEPPRASAENRRRMQYLQDEGLVDLPNAERPRCHQADGHSYKSMYGRLSWDLPAQTVTSGFGSIGQGRYMHPSEIRALTPHEAARIQGFPDYFDFSAIALRSSLATMIGNAVPPQLSRSIFAELLPDLTAAGD